MKIEVTSEVNSHRVNPRYKCLLVHFEEDKDALHKGKDGFNWMPRDQELLTIVRALWDVSPTFNKRLREMLAYGSNE